MNKTDNVIEKYKKQELFKNIGFGIIAFVIGFGVSQIMNNNSINTNFLKNDLNSSLQIASSSVTSKDAEKQEKKDISLERIDKNNLEVDLNKDIEQAEKITFNIDFENDKVNILEIKSLDENLKLTQVDTKNGLKIISLKVLDKSKKIPKKILNIKIEKKFKSGEDFSFINISSANYLKNSEVYPITSSGINVF